MNEAFYYWAMWGALRGNLAYELSVGGRDLMPLQMAIQTRCTRLYVQSRDLPDPYGGRMEALEARSHYAFEYQAPKPPKAPLPV